jgi:hypothetical protein
MINIPCPVCGKALYIPEDFAGQTGTCQYCQGLVTAPSLAEARLKNQIASGEASGTSFTPTVIRQRKRTTRWILLPAAGILLALLLGAAVLVTALSGRKPEKRIGGAGLAAGDRIVLPHPVTAGNTPENLDRALAFSASEDVDALKEMIRFLEAAWFKKGEEIEVAGISATDDLVRIRPVKAPHVFLVHQYQLAGKGDTGAGGPPEARDQRAALRAALREELAKTENPEAEPDTAPESQETQETAMETSGLEPWRLPELLALSARARELLGNVCDYLCADARNRDLARQWGMQHDPLLHEMQRERAAAAARDDGLACLRIHGDIERLLIGLFERLSTAPLAAETGAAYHEALAAWQAFHKGAEELLISLAAPERESFAPLAPLAEALGETLDRLEKRLPAKMPPP